MATDSWIDKSPTCGGWNNALLLGNRFKPLATDRVILGQYETSQIMNFGEKSTANFAIHLRLIPDKFGKWTVSQPTFHRKERRLRRVSATKLDIENKGNGKQERKKEGSK